MKDTFIYKFLGFLVGFLITLIIINYFNNKKKLKVIEKYSTSSDIKLISTIPSNVNKFLAINSFEDKIKTAENRWYSIDDANKFFSYVGTLELVPNGVNTDLINGAKIDRIQLNGPSCYTFANNLVTNELNEFSIYFAGKFKGVSHTNNILFELIGNSEAIDYPNDVKYLPSVVNLNFQKNQNNNFDIIITIGNVIYKGLINNIDKAVIINNDVINFYLSYSASELVFGINKQIFKYKVDNTAFKVKLGSLPFIINKGGNFNLDLYLFVFYKSVITFTEVQQLSRFTYSNLSGLETVINSTPKCDVIPPTTIQTNLDDKFKEMENRIVKLIENKNLKIEEQPKLEIKPLKLQSINENDKVIINNNNNIQHKPFYKWFF
jgi:hypothetical protein